MDLYNMGCHSNTYTPIPSQGAGREWCDGMVSGNGKIGYVTSGAPYDDTFVLQNIFFIYPSDDPRNARDDLFRQLDDARYAVYKRDDSYKIKNYDENGNAEIAVRRRCYMYHPGPQLRLSHCGDKVIDYVRWTDYEAALTGVRYANSSGTWTRTAYTSRTDDAIIIHMTKSSSGAKIDISLSFDEISGMCRAEKIPAVHDQRYRILADRNSISYVSHYPEFENSELKHGGYGCVCRVLTDGEVINKCDKSPSEKMNIGDKKTLNIKNASDVVIIIKCDRTHDMGSMTEFCESDGQDNTLLKRLNQEIDDIAQGFSYDENFKQHLKIQKEAYLRHSVSLSNAKNISNEQLIKMQKETTDRLVPEFVQKAYNQGRYANLCTAGYTAPRLYGMWCGEWAPSWRSAYTLDANVNLQTSAMNVACIPLAADGYINFVFRNLPDWMINAAKAYGMHDALMTGVNSDGDRCMNIEYDNSYPFCYWNAGASWCLMPLYEDFCCSGNRKIYINEYMNFERLQKILSVEDGGMTDEKWNEILNRGYLDYAGEVLLPLLAKQANFWEQLVTPKYYMTSDGVLHFDPNKTELLADEKYALLPGYSPENHPEGCESCLSANVAMDISAAKNGLDMVIYMEEYVKRDGWEKAREKWKNLKDRLPDYKIDTDGALCEWSVSGYRENNLHRHISHLYPAWPAFETKDDISLSGAVEQAMKNRSKHDSGEIVQGHGYIHRALVEARLSNASKSEKALLGMLLGDTYFTSMMTDHDTNRIHGSYCTDTSIGFTTVINEMIVYSDENRIEILPAMPNSLSKGTVYGIKTRCGVDIEKINWDLEKGEVVVYISSASKDKLSYVSITSKYKMEIR